MLALLALALLPTAEPTPRAAVERALKVIAAGAERYTVKKTCFSCHHQALPLLVFGAARSHGWKVPAGAIARQVEFTRDYLDDRREMLPRGLGLGGGNTMGAYALVAFAAADAPADDLTRGLVDYLLKRQHKNGSWPAVAHRPPSEGSPFAATALALDALSRYAPDKRTESARLRARAWLLATPAADTEDAVFRLWGLTVVGADAAARAAAQKQLLALQLPDGGWPQLPDRTADAYATGSALVALHRSGLTTGPAFVRGQRFLVRTQDATGYWLITTRAKPVQTFFDNGDAGGKGQFISFAATCWATWALMLDPRE